MSVIGAIVLLAIYRMVIEQRTREPVPRTGLLVLLKTFQRLGYFVIMNEVPKPIVLLGNAETVEIM